MMYLWQTSDLMYTHQTEQPFHKEHVLSNSSFVTWCPCDRHQTAFTHITPHVHTLKRGSPSKMSMFYPNSFFVTSFTCVRHQTSFTDLIYSIRQGGPFHKEHVLSELILCDIIHLCQTSDCIHRHQTSCTHIRQGEPFHKEHVLS